MLYFSIENARGEREKSPLLRGGLRRTVSCSDVARQNFGESFCVAGAVFGEFGQ